MGKPLRSQRRGKGSPTYRAKPKKFMPRLNYREIGGKIIDIVKDPARNSPLIKVKYDDEKTGFLVAVEGMTVGETINEQIKTLSDLTEGTQISCIESAPSSGPKFCRAPGSFATLISKTKNQAIILLPSKKTMRLPRMCKATIGIPAGEGRREKPFLKAGAKYHLMKAKSRKYPRTSGMAMNAVDHPYGGSGSGTKRSPVSRHAPRGAKVGQISPRGGKLKRTR